MSPELNHELAVLVRIVNEHIGPVLVGAFIWLVIAAWNYGEVTIRRRK